MKKFRIVLALSGISLAGAIFLSTGCGLPMAPRSALAAPDLVVAVNGSDTAVGTAAAPFATLERARLAVRSLRAGQPGRYTPIVVQLRGGTYFLAAPLTLSAEDSGTAEAPVVYTNWPGETVTISGGVVLDHWTVEPDGRWSTTLPEVKNGTWNFRQLFVDGQRRARPRLPAEGYYHIAAKAPRSAGSKPGEGDDRFAFKAGEIQAHWQNLGDVEVTTFHPWYTSMLRIEAVDDAASTVTFTGRTRHSSDWAALKAGMRYLVDNVKEALGAPGQWYLDRPTGKLTYIPRPGETPAGTVVIAPRLDKLLELRGQGPDKYVQYVTFQGLTLAHTNWVTPPGGSSIPQAAVDATGAIYATGARHCAWNNCTITLTGGYGIELAAGCRDNRIANCRLTDLGAGGIKLGTTGYQADPQHAAGGNTATNNLIAHGGRLHPAACGVWIGQSDHNTVAHNDIYDFYYTAISVGWTWGYSPSGAHHNTIEYNHLHHLGQAVLSDMGGIYTLGLSPGSVLRYNLIHDVRRVDYGGWGIYYDEGTSGMVAENNVVYRTDDGGFHQHYGENNIFRNNIIAASAGVQIRGTRVTREDQKTIQDQAAFTFTHNIVAGWGPAGPADHWPDTHLNPPRSFYELNHNLYWNGGQPVTIPPRDKESLAADPHFVDAAHDNYALRSDTPAGQIGFTPFDIRPAGRWPREMPDLDPMRWPRQFPPAR